MESLSIEVQILATQEGEVTCKNYGVCCPKQREITCKNYEVCCPKKYFIRTVKLKCIIFLYCIKDNCIYLFIKQQAEQAVGTKKKKKKRKEKTTNFSVSFRSQLLYRDITFYQIERRTRSFLASRTENFLM